MATMMHQNPHLLLRTVLPRRHSFAASAAPARTAAVAFIGLGGNIGDRAGNLLRALRELEALPSTRLLDTSRLYESAPMYVEAQPRFLNAAALLETRLSPCELLGGLKRIERLLGRDHHGGMRNGPRPIDLDILLFGTRGGGTAGAEALDLESVRWLMGTWGCPSSDPLEEQYDDDEKEQEEALEGLRELLLPHPRMGEREFVLGPICDMVPKSLAHPVTGRSLHSMLRDLRTKQNSSASLPSSSSSSLSSSSSSSSSCVAVFPLSRDHLVPVERPHGRLLVMGILNVTPDSFSDGGKFATSTSTSIIRSDYDDDEQAEEGGGEGDVDVEAAVRRGLALVADGASVVDIGGESTRPGAAEQSVATQLARVLPVIRGLAGALGRDGHGDRGDEDGQDGEEGEDQHHHERQRQRRRRRRVVISIDTRSAAVARAAVAAGAGMVNDVSGGRHDPAMLATVKDLAVPFVAMHMRGDPQTMQQTRHTTYGGGDASSINDNSSGAGISGTSGDSDASSEGSIVGDGNRGGEEDDGGGGGGGGSGGGDSGSSTAAAAAAGDVVVDGVGRELRATAGACVAAGIPRWSLLLDPGVGFAKTHRQSTALLGSRNLRSLRERWLARAPLLVGASRKGFLGTILSNDHAAATAAAAAAGIEASTESDSAATSASVSQTDSSFESAVVVAAAVAVAPKEAAPPAHDRWHDRDVATAATSLLAAASDSVFMVRVHDVRGTKQALAVASAVREADGPEER